MTFERTHPFIRPEAEKERKEKFNKPPYEVSSDFLDEFTGKEVNSIRTGNRGIVSQNLDSAVNRLLSEAAAEKGKEYASALETFVFDNLRFHPFAYKGVKDYEKLEGEAKTKKDEELAVMDRDIRKKALFYLFEDLKSKGLLAEEVQKEFEEELNGKEVLEDA